MKNKMKFIVLIIILLCTGGLTIRNVYKNKVISHKTTNNSEAVKQNMPDAEEKNNEDNNQEVNHTTNINEDEAKNIGGKRVVSGTITLPEGEKDDIDIIINARSENGQFSDRVEITLESGSAEYELFLEEADYYIEYYYPNIRRVYKYKSGWYSENGVVVGNAREKAAIIQVRKEDISGIDIELIENESIEGIVSLPEGEVAKEDGFDVSINSVLYKDGQLSSTYAHIREGENSVKYKLYVEKGIYGVWINIKGYIAGHYSDDGIVMERDDATKIEVQEKESKRVDIKIPKRKRSIKGKISLPEGEVAPKEGLMLKLTAYTGDYQKYKNYIVYHYSIVKEIEIKEGESSIEYEVSVDEAEYGLAYEILGESQYCDGFYNNSKIVGDIEEASKLNLKEKVQENIIIELKKSKLIKGEIQLLDGQVAPEGGMHVTVTPIKINQYGEYSLNSIKVKIIEGDNSVKYEIPVEGGNSYVLFTELLKYKGKDNERYQNIVSYENIAKGYNGFEAKEISEARIIDVQEMDIENINIEIGEIEVIKGKVSLEKGDVALEGGVYIGLGFLRDIGKGYIQEWRYVYIEEGKNCADYKFHFLGKGSNIISAELKNFEGVIKGYRRIYYNKQGPVKKKNQATIIHNKDNLEDINIELEKRESIRGKISLPKGEVAPKGGIVVALRAKNIIKKDEWNVSSVTILEGENSANYEIFVGRRWYNSEHGISIKQGIYTIEYDVKNQKGFLKGYYSNEGTVLSEKDAGKIEIMDEDIEKIDIELWKVQ